MAVQGNWATSRWFIEERALAMNACPACGAKINAVPLSVNECQRCKRKWVASVTDPAPHCLSEVTCGEKNRGTLTVILHPVGTKVCPTCGDVYPEKLSCCPALFKLALGAFISPDEEGGSDERRKLLEFLLANKAMLQEQIRDAARTGTKEYKEKLRKSGILLELDSRYNGLI